MNFASTQKNEVIQKIETIATELSNQNGVVLYDVELVSTSEGPVLRIYIDKDGGVSVDDCANVSRGLNDYLDNNDPVPGANYALEVSSPGVDRPLNKPWHFEKVVGTQIWVKLNSSLEKYGCTDGKYKPAKSITEDLVAVDNGNLKFMLSGQEIVIPMAEIDKAKVSFNFETKKEKPGHKKDHKKAKQ